MAVTPVSAVHKAAEATFSSEQNGASAHRDHTTETTAGSRESTQNLHTDPDCMLTLRLPKTINSDWKVN